jgi:hypothetical protein
MVSVEVSRQSVSVAADAGLVSSVSRVGVEVAALATEANGTDAALISRISFEVVSKAPAQAGASRMGSEVATLATEANAVDALQISRLSVEVVSSPIKEAGVTRLGVEVATPAAQLNAIDPVLISRVSIEAVTRRGFAGAVVPLPLAAGIDVFLHNWANKASLSSSYVTDIEVSSTTSAESRLGLVLKPDRSVEFVWQTDDVARLDRLYVMLRKLTNERIAVPLYMDQRELAGAATSGDSELYFDTTVGRWGVGARVVAVQFTPQGGYLSHSFHLISNIEANRLVFDSTLGEAIAAGAVIMPMMDCEVVLEAVMQNRTARNGTVKMELVEVPGPSALLPTKADNPTNAQVFEGAPIFDIDPNWDRGIDKGRQRDGEVYSLGRAQRVFTTGARSRETHGLRFDGDRTEAWRLVEFFDTRRGRLRSFWLVDHEFIWNTAEIDASGTFVGVSELGDFDDFKAELEGEWIGLVMSDGSIHVREVVTIQQVLTVFRCTLNTALPLGLLVGDVVRIARARKTRFDNDEMRESWTHTGLVSTNLGFIEVLEEKNVTT